MADVVVSTSVPVPLQFFRMHLDPAHACCRFAARLVSADGTYLSADTTTLFIDAMLQEADARHSSWCGSAKAMPWAVWRPGNGSFFMAESSYISHPFLAARRAMHPRLNPSVRHERSSMCAVARRQPHSRAASFTPRPVRGSQRS